jgi:Flp pilus assembly CpaE family ATPase
VVANPHIAAPLVTVAHPDPAAAEALRHAIVAAGWRVALAGDGAAGLAAAMACQPAVAVIGCGLLPGLPVATGPDGVAVVPLLAVGDDQDAADLRAAVTAGARGLIAWPDGAADLEAELVRLAGPPRPSRRSPGGSPPAGTVVAVMGVQGGAGATTLACHLAGTWAGYGPGPVLLADLAGGLAFRLDLDPGGPGWDVAAALTQGPEPSLTADVFAEPWPGLSVLPLPDRADDKFVPDPATIGAVLGAAASAFGVVVVDLPARGGPAVAAALAAADLLLAVCRPDSAGLRGLHAAAESWEIAGNDASTCGLVVMGAAANSALAPRVFRAQFGSQLWSVIPASPPEFNEAAEEGVLLLDRNELAAVQAMLTLAQRAVPYAAEATV